MKAKRKPLDVHAAGDLVSDYDAEVRTLGYGSPAGAPAGEMVESVDELITKLRDEAKAI